MKWRGFQISAGANELSSIGYREIKMIQWRALENILVAPFGRLTRLAREKQSNFSRICIFWRFLLTKTNKIFGNVFFSKLRVFRVSVFISEVLLGRRQAKWHKNLFIKRFTDRWLLKWNSVCFRTQVAGRVIYDVPCWYDVLWDVLRVPQHFSCQDWFARR